LSLSTFLFPQIINFCHLLIVINIKKTGVYGSNSWFGREHRKELRKFKNIQSIEERVLEEFRRKVPNTIRERLLLEAQQKLGGLKFLSKEDTERIEKQAAKAWRKKGHVALMKIVWAAGVITK
jgi:hypothetical protein